MPCMYNGILEYIIDRYLLARLFFIPHGPLFGCCQEPGAGATHDCRRGVDREGGGPTYADRDGSQGKKHVQAHLQHLPYLSLLRMYGL